MKLQAWLDKKNKSRVWFASKFRPKPIASQTVDAWCREVSPAIPKPPMMQEIKRITRNAVRETDFYPNIKF